jgi:hypothetical protein
VADFAARTLAEMHGVDALTAEALLSVVLPTVGQAEDAAANALAGLIADALTDYPTEIVSPATLRVICRDLLRGPVDEDYSRRPGGYCMRSPTDPTRRAIGHLGAQLVERSYMTTDPARALALARELWADFEKEMKL